jgi:[ribosomal protein S18]-alanine N-acetyltransferase
LTWLIRDVTEEDARAISQWRYPEPYSLYDSSPDDVAGLLDPANQYFAVIDEAGDLVGFGCFGPDARVPGGTYADDAIDWGTGMRPDLTGQGRGFAFFQLVCDEARSRWPDKLLRTTVAAFNERSQHLVRKLGLQEVEIFRNPAGREFVVFVGR